MYQASSRLGQGGRVVVPAELRKELGVSDGDVLLFQKSDSGEIVLTTRQQAMRKLQAMMRPLGPQPGEPLASEQFIAERRAAAAKE